MANKKFSEFVLKTTTSDVSHIVGYNGAENVQITPANFVTTGGTGVFLPLDGGIMVGNTIHNDNVKSIYGDSGDLEIYHSGAGSYIVDNGTGNLDIRADSLSLLNAAGNEYYARFYTNGAAYLYNNGVAKFYTTGTGAEVIGDLVVTGSITGVGGSYLPLAGGTLTGALTGTSATFVGNVTVSASNSLLIRDDGSFIKEDQGLQIGNTSVTGATRPIRFFTESVERLTIDSSGNSTFAGNVGIKDNPSFALDVNIASSRARFKAATGDASIELSSISGRDYLIQSKTDGSFVIYDEDASSERLRLDALGNLGVGVVPLVDGMHLERTTSSPVLLVKASGQTGSLTPTATLILAPGSSSGQETAPKITGFRTADFSSAAARSTGLKFSVSANNQSKDAMIINQAGNVGINSSSYYGFNGSGDASQSVGYNAGIDGTMLRGQNGVIFGTGGGTTATERMRINSSGKVGINEDSPAAKLVVNQNSLVDTEGIFVQSGSSPADGGVAIFKSASKIGTISALGGASSLSFMTNGGSEKMRINSDGDLLVGTSSTNPTSGVSILDTDAGAYIMTDHLNGTASGTAFAIFRYNQSQIGSIQQNGTSAVQFNTSSDYRLKEDLQDFKGLEMVSKIPVYDYKWKAEDSRSYGVMAHELAEVLPQAVSGDKDAEEMQSVDYSKIVPLLVKSIQELSAKLELLECQCKNK